MQIVAEVNDVSPAMATDRRAREFVAPVASWLPIGVPILDPEIQIPKHILRIRVVDIEMPLFG